MPTASVEVTIEGFSGPLDLLCHLVESRQMQASKIKVAHLVRIYGAYLSQTQKASVDVLADFFFSVAELLLQKTRSLLPDASQEVPPEDCVDEGVVDEQEFLEKLARYRPYRVATSWLEDQKRKQDRSFRRVASEAPPVEPFYAIGDLYFLSRVWWGLFGRFLEQNKRGAALFEEIDEGWNGMPEALPEESQIQSRIEELEKGLERQGFLSLNALWRSAPSVKTLVVTLLAILEMCRMGKICIEQETLFSDVEVRAKR